MQAPLYLARPGYINGGSLNGAGGSGNYWSSTIYNLERARFLGFDPSGANPEYDYYRYRGFSVRCVLRESQFILFLIFRIK